MRREDLGDLMAFLMVVEERSFTRAAAKLGTSQSALSHTVRRLEENLGIRLLTRTTRRVSATEAGERLAKTLRPSFDDIEHQIDSLNELREKPAGTIRITSIAHAAENILWPAIKPLVAQYPDLNVEISVEQKLTDIVSERFDAGVRLGEQVDKDMIAIPIGPQLRMAVVGAPSCFEKKGIPQKPQDLLDHECINLRLPTLGGLYAWELEKDGRLLNVRVGGQLIFNSVAMLIDAAVEGMGLICIPEDHILEYEKSGRLMRVLKDWCPPFPGYHLYYPNRRQHSPAFALIIKALRYRGP